jgi:hypothetical protein
VRRVAAHVDAVRAPRREHAAADATVRTGGSGRCVRRRLGHRTGAGRESARCPSPR